MLFTLNGNSIEFDSDYTIDVITLELYTVYLKGVLIVGDGTPVYKKIKYTLHQDCSENRLRLVDDQTISQTYYAETGI